MNEFELIKKITKNFKQTDKLLIKGIGDDCAIFKGKKDHYLITTDALIEDVHFKTDYTSFIDLGFKSLAVNISDIAAMSGKPLFFTVSIAVPKKHLKDVRKIYKGMLKASEKYDCKLIGGDTVSSKSRIFISITVIGKSKKYILRSNAKQNDLIFVTGFPGMSSLGLKCLEKKYKNKKSLQFIKKHSTPSPRIALSNKLNKFASSMIDISDGLLSDIEHIADLSKCGYEINLNKIPVKKDFFNISKKLKCNSAELILSGGEDYELLFTASKQFKKDILKLSTTTCPITNIGVILSNKNTRNVLNNKGEKIKIKKMGFDHFKKNKS